MGSYPAANPELQRKIEEVVRVSRGAIDAILVAKPDGTPIAQANSINLNPDYLAAAVSALSGVISSILEIMDMGEFNKVNVELSDKRYIFIVPYKGNYVAVITKPNPNIGFVSLILDVYFEERL